MPGAHKLSMNRDTLPMNTEDETSDDDMSQVECTPPSRTSRELGPAVVRLSFSDDSSGDEVQFVPPPTPGTEVRAVRPPKLVRTNALVRPLVRRPDSPRPEASAGVFAGKPRARVPPFVPPRSVDVEDPVRTFERLVAEGTSSVVVAASPNHVQRQGWSREPAAKDRARGWVYVCNNYTAVDEAALVVMFGQKYLTFYCHGYEGRGGNRTPHLQGFLQSTAPISMKALKAKLTPRFHLEICLFPENYITYCQKECLPGSGPSGYCPTTWKEEGVLPVFGLDKRQKKGGDANSDRWASALAHARAGDFDALDPDILFLHLSHAKRVREHHVTTSASNTVELSNEWHCGPTGCGKSRYVRSTPYYGDIYLKLVNKWWDHYNGEPTVLIEELDPGNCHLLASRLKMWTDHYSFAAETKGGNTKLRPVRIVITSNYTIEQCFPDPRDYLPLRRRCEECVWSADGTFVRRPKGWSDPTVPAGTHPSFVAPNMPMDPRAVVTAAEFGAFFEAQNDRGD